MIGGDKVLSSCEKKSKAIGNSGIKDCRNSGGEGIISRDN
jgi:hypothetical protein